MRNQHLIEKAQSFRAVIKSNINKNKSLKLSAMFAKRLIVAYTYPDIIFVKKSFQRSQRNGESHEKTDGTWFGFVDVAHNRFGVGR